MTSALPHRPGRPAVCPGRSTGRVSAPLLGVDAGNSTISIALLRPAAVTGFGGVEVVGTIRLPAHPQPARRTVEAAVRGLCASRGLRPHRAVLSSVVPPLTPPLTASLLSLGMRVHTVRAALAPAYGVRLDVSDPSSVGSDLVADSVAARSLGAAVIVDAGTATKVLALRGGRFLGVTIAPGPGILGRSLGAGTAQLPAIAPTRPASVLGRTTRSAMVSGVYFEALGGIRETLGRVMRAMPRGTVSILTGGYSRLFAGERIAFRVRDPDFLQRGLYRIGCSAPEGSWTLPQTR